MWNANIYLENRNYPKNNAKTKQNGLLDPDELIAGRLFRKLKRQELLRGLDVKEAINRLEESIKSLETNSNKSRPESFGRDVDLRSREVALYLGLTITFSKDFGCDKCYSEWLKYEYDRATTLIQNAGKSFKRYSGWPFDFFSKCAKSRLEGLEYATKTFQPSLLKGTN